MRIKTKLLGLKAHLNSELEDNILDYWLTTTADTCHGGFYGYVSNDGYIEKEADKGLVMMARFLWAYSAAYNHYKDSKYLHAAERALMFLTIHLHDEKNRGYFWTVDYRGKVKETRKQTYGQAFALYGLSEYYKATKDRDVFQIAREVFDLLEEKARDPKRGGYVEALDENWQPLANTALSAVDLDCHQSMNTNLHVLEALTNYYRIDSSPEVAEALSSLIQVFMDKIRDPASEHLQLYFDENWRSLKDVISFGHDIEASWLIWEALEVLQDKDLMDRYRPAVIAMAERTLAEGWDPQKGGIINEQIGSHLDTNKIWWPQAEAMVGFFNAWQLTQRRDFLEAVFQTWSYIQEEIIDQEEGEWFWGRDPKGTLLGQYEKGGNWKTPYHNGRACIEIMERIKEHCINQ